jgi:hypothetical protein
MSPDKITAQFYHLSRRVHAEQIMKHGFKGYPIPSTLTLSGVRIWDSMPANLEAGEDDVSVVVEIDPQRVAPYRDIKQTMSSLKTFTVPASLLREHGRAVKIVEIRKGK